MQKFPSVAMSNDYLKYSQLKLCFVGKEGKIGGDGVRGWGGKNGN